MSATRSDILQLIDAVGQLEVVDLGRPISSTTPVTPHMVPFSMALSRRHGDVIRDDGASGATELMALSAHTGTHIDALGHVSDHGQLHGGLDAQEVQRGGRLSTLGAETLPVFVGRGVLLDVPGALGLAPEELAGRPTTAEDLEAVANAHGIEVQPGDAVLIRSGWAAAQYGDAERYIGWTTGVPGPDIAAARWLTDHGARLVGSDTAAFEHLAPGAGHSRLPVHRHMLVAAGVPIIEHLDLEPLAAAGAHEFILMLAPLKIVGATASPIRPLALVPR